MINRDLLILSTLSMVLSNTLILTFKVNAQEITVKVIASQDCINTGVEVSSGESVQFSASGQANYGYEGSPVNAEPLTNPNGNRFVNGRSIGQKIDTNALFPQAPIGGLIGIIDNNNYFFVGGNNKVIMPKSGTLYLCYNDVANQYDNNKGSYLVSIHKQNLAQNQRNNGFTTRPQTLTWKEFVADIAKGGSGGFGRAYIDSNYDLPNGFQNGYIYRWQGANSIRIFILKEGLSQYPVPISSGLDQIPLGNQYVNSGQAISFFWNLGNSAIPYMNDTQVRFTQPGTGCLKNVCLDAPFLSNSEISKILYSRRPIKTADIFQSRLTGWQLLKAALESGRDNQFKRNAFPSELPSQFANWKIAITALNNYSFRYILIHPDTKISNLSSVKQLVANNSIIFNGYNSGLGTKILELPAIDTFPQSVYTSGKVIEVARYAAKFDGAGLRRQISQSRTKQLPDGRNAYYINAVNERSGWCVLDGESAQYSHFTCVNIANSPDLAYQILQSIAQNQRF